MPDDLFDTSGLDRRPPASEQAIAHVERALQFTFPDDYRTFLLASNGGEGFMGATDNYLMLWPVEELPEAHADYEVDLMAPGRVLFGSSGGGVFYAFERETARVVELPSMPVDVEYAEPVAASFGEFLRSLAAQS